jgi:hypothetical protein
MLLEICEGDRIPASRRGDACGGNAAKRDLPECETENGAVARKGACS